MISKKKYAILTLVILCVLCFCYIINSKTHDKFDFTLGNYSTNTDITGDINLSENLSGISNLDLKFQGKQVPYNVESNTIYIPQNYSEDFWYGKLTSDTYEIIVPYDSYWDSKQEAISESHRFTVFMRDNNQYYSVYLIITGTPFISITNSIEVGDDIYWQISIFDPGNEDRGYEINTLYCEFYERGATSRTNDKVSYRINLLNDSLSDDKYMSLLGMSSSRKWNLNPLFTDGTKVREKTAVDIWNLMDQESGWISTYGIEEEYVEVLWDNSYLGLYCLVRPVDYETQNLNTNDALYKFKTWDIPTLQEMDISIAEQLDYVAGIYLKYPKYDYISDFISVWGPLRDWLDAFYIETDDWNYEEYCSLIDVDNTLNYFLYINVVTAVDNFYKNIYLVTDYAPDNSAYKIYVIPWDLDATFGDSWYYGGFSEDYHKLLRYMPAVKLYQSNPNLINQRITELWEGYQSVFSADKIEDMLLANYEYLSYTGAYIREQERWPDNIDLDMESLLTYNQNHMQYLDELISTGRLMEVIINGG